MSTKPYLIIINGPGGAGKTTLGQRLSAELRLPFISKDGCAAVLYDALECETTGRPKQLGSAAVRMMHYFAATTLAVGHSLIVEGSFFMPELATEEFRQLQQRHPFEPIQIQCVADGEVLLERIIARSQSGQRHAAHNDLQFLEKHKELVLRGRYDNLDIGGQIIELDTTDFSQLDFEGLCQTLGKIIKARD